MKKLILKYIGIGLGALIILAFAVYFTLSGPDGAIPSAEGGSSPKASSGDTASPGADAGNASAAGEDGAAGNTGAAQEVIEAQVGDVVEIPDIYMDDDSVTWDVYKSAVDPAASPEEACEAYVFHNKLDMDMDLYVDIEYTYPSGAPQIYTICLNNIPAGGDACLWTQPGDYEGSNVSFMARRPQSGSVTIADSLKADYTDTGDGISGTITNTSDYDARYVDAVVLFLKGRDVVTLKDIPLYVGKDAIAPGESQDFSASAEGKDYSKVRVYLTGYGE